MNKKFAAAMAIVLGASATVFAFTQTPKASEPALELTKLSPDTIYKYDLDQDGNLEEISYTLTDNWVYELDVNGVKTEIPLDECFYNPELAIMDIDSKDHQLDLWADCYAFSNDISYGSLFHYQDGQLESIWEADRGASMISTDSNGTFFLRYDRLFPADNLVGNHWDQLVYHLENNQVCPVESDTIKISETLDNYEFTEGKVTPLVCADNLKFYLQPGEEGSFNLKAGTIVTPKEIKPVTADSCYVSFETQDGQIGWLFSDDYDWENQPFSNMCFCD